MSIVKEYTVFLDRDGYAPRIKADNVEEVGDVTVFYLDGKVIAKFGRIVGWKQE